MYYCNLILNKPCEFALYFYICKEKKESILSKQMVISANSIYANLEEKRVGQSKKDFTSKILKATSKESREAQFCSKGLNRSVFLGYYSGRKELPDEPNSLIDIFKKNVKISYKRLNKC